jgi:ankyrin repeat protein
LYEVALLLIRMDKVSLVELTNTAWTALHFAAKGGHDDVLSLLMPKAKEVWNAQTADKFTPIHLACMGKHLEALAVLIEQDGVDASMPAASGVCFVLLRLVCILPQCMDLSKASKPFLQVER